MNDPRCYDVGRIIGLVLEKGLPKSSGDVNALAFRSKFGEKGGLSHEFLEYFSGTDINGILFSPEKHLTAKQRGNLAAVPEVPRKDYESLEAVLKTFADFSRKLDRLHALIGDIGRYYREPHGVRAVSGAFEELVRDMNNIILTEYPEHYPAVYERYREYLTSFYPVYPGSSNEEEFRNYLNIQDFARSYYGLCKGIKSDYSEKIFGTGDPVEAVERLGVEIRRYGVKFGEHFLDSLPPKAGEKSDYAEDICKSGKSIAVVDAGGKNIPYAFEAKALRALKLIIGRPLVNVYGESSAKGIELVNNLASREILEAADRLKANVSAPGVQAGVARELGRAYLDYQEERADKEPEDKARVFSVSTKGETYFPGNSALSGDGESKPVPIAPFDTILTRYDAGWAWKGDRMREAPYIQHLEYAEALYERMREGSPRAGVVCGGDAFTAVAVAGALANSVPVLFVAGSGGFADLAVALMRSFSQWHLLESSSDRVGLDKRILEIIGKEVDPALRGRIYELFGGDETAADAGQVFFREKIREFLIISRGKKVEVTSAADLGKRLAELMAG